MKIAIEKNSNDYTLEITSGHFTGILKSIPQEKIKELSESLNRLLTNDEAGVYLVWNPRSQRLERKN